MTESTRRYWDDISDRYQGQTRISCEDFHYGPLLPGENELGLLPRSVRGLTCVELGCGAAQNSIVLARQGADCIAIDASGGQLGHARRLARRHRVDVHFVLGDMTRLPLQRNGTVDLVHSTYALPFVDRQQAVVRDAAAVLRPGGLFVLTTAHPLWFSEWVELDSREQGILVQNYFQPPSDSRHSSRGGGRTSCRPSLLSDVSSWLAEAGLMTRRFLEPVPLPVPNMAPSEIRERIPYFSDSWLALYPQLALVPAVAIFIAEKTR